MLPVLIETDNGIKIGITESALEDYAGFHVRKSAKPHALEAAFPKYPTEAKPGGHMNFNLIVQQRADYIASTSGERTFPWRVFKIAYEDIELLDTDLVYKLSDPPAEGMDFSWVKPGKVAWDWWNAINLTGVNFRSGINTESYKYFIDFAARNGIEYINLDEGWSDQYDILKLSDEIDLEEIVNYADSKGVGVFLWCVHWPLDKQLDEAMNMFDRLGIKGLKIDFMDRDDQVMVDFYYRIAEVAAEHQLLVNFHGAYKPSGLHRKYPNVINREAVRGLEYNKFSKPYGTTPEYAVSIPFIRMLAGPMDYTPGAMTNAQKANFAVFNERPMSQGTRCQQLAMYVVYEAPLQMISDAPTAYEAAPEILRFISDVPTDWDETVALDGKVADFALIARRKGDAWYVGGMTDWSPRTLDIDFSFLGTGTYTAEIFRDGINADRHAEDHKREVIEVNNMKRMQVKLAPGGGVAMKIYPAK
jgi:alpha-glucosidase